MGRSPEERRRLWEEREAWLNAHDPVVRKLNQMRWRLDLQERLSDAAEDVGRLLPAAAGSPAAYDATLRAGLAEALRAGRAVGCFLEGRPYEGRVIDTDDHRYEPRIMRKDVVANRKRLARVLGRFAEAIDDLLSKLEPRLPDPDRDPRATGVFLHEACGRMVTACENAAALLRTGRLGGDVDAFVQRVLQENRP